MVDWLSLTGTCADVRSLRLSFGACSSLLQLADVQYCTIIYLSSGQENPQSTHQLNQYNGSLRRMLL
jgi:hypothetical protein